MVRVNPHVINGKSTERFFGIIIGRMKLLIFWNRHCSGRMQWCLNFILQPLLCLRCTNSLERTPKRPPSVCTSS